MELSNRRAPLKKGRRVSINVNLSNDTIRELGKIGEGNRSKGIEELVDLYRASKLQPDTAA